MLACQFCWLRPYYRSVGTKLALIIFTWRVQLSDNIIKAAGSPQLGLHIFGSSAEWSRFVQSYTWSDTTTICLNWNTNTVTVWIVLHPNQQSQKHGNTREGRRWLDVEDLEENSEGEKAENKGMTTSISLIRLFKTDAVWMKNGF